MKSFSFSVDNIHFDNIRLENTRLENIHLEKTYPPSVTFSLLVQSSRDPQVGPWSKKGHSFSIIKGSE